MNRKPFEEITRTTVSFSRRWIAGGAFGAALAGTSGLLETGRLAPARRARRATRRRNVGADATMVKSARRAAVVVRAARAS